MKRHQNRIRFTRFLKNFHPVKKFGIAVDSNIGNIIKVISFIVAFAIFAVSLAGGFLLFSIDSLLKLIGIGLIILGTVIALISLFLIYGIGHIICQNNEILNQNKE